MNESSFNPIISGPSSSPLAQWAVHPQTIPTQFVDCTRMPVQIPLMDQQLRLFGPTGGPLLTDPVPWNHTIPVSMPWFQGQNPFPSAGGCSYGFEQNRPPAFQNKRKGEQFEDVSVPTKQYISEEVMATRLKEMHISNKYSGAVPHGDPNSMDAGVLKGRDPILTLQDLEARLKEDCEVLDMNGKPNIDEPVLVLAPEIAKIETEPILPRSIVNRLQKPTMEMVLWKPPGGLVDHLIRSTLEKDDHRQNSDHNHNNNNNNNVPLGRMELSPEEFSSLTKFNGTTSNIAGRSTFSNFRTYVVPAMTQNEIDALEEEMNL